MSTVYNPQAVPVDLTGGRVIPPGEEAKVADEEITDREHGLASEGLLVITDTKRASAKTKEEAG